MLPANLPVNLELLTLLFKDLRDGVAIADATEKGFPLIYINKSFESITGYSFDQVQGKNCRFLQGEDTEQAHVEEIRQALTGNTPLLITLKNYRKNGEPFWNELSLSPIIQDDKPLFFISIQKDVTEKILFEQRIINEMHALRSTNKVLERKADTDGLTGLKNRHYFDMECPVRLRIAQRYGLTVSVYMIDVDHFKLYNDHYGHLAGDTCLVNIAKAMLSCFSRATDICARFGGEEFIVFSTDSSRQESINHGQRLVDMVGDLTISHEESQLKKVTVSVGILHLEGKLKSNSKTLIDIADKALYQAKSNGRNQVIQTIV